MGHTFYQKKKHIWVTLIQRYLYVFFQSTIPTKILNTCNLIVLIIIIISHHSLISILDYRHSSILLPHPNFLSLCIYNHISTSPFLSISFSSQKNHTLKQCPKTQLQFQSLHGGSVRLISQTYQFLFLFFQRLILKHFCYVTTFETRVSRNFKKYIIL